MVMNPTHSSFDTLLKYQLEPEIYEPNLLNQIIDYAHAKQQTIGIHIELDTGMKRLGFEQKDSGRTAGRHLHRPWIAMGEPVCDRVGWVACLEGLADVFNHEVGRDMSSKFDAFRDWPKRGDHSDDPAALAAGIMTDAAQILDVVQREWAAVGSWSDHDQAVRCGCRNTTPPAAMSHTLALKTTGVGMKDDLV
jgi:hypothetical protein